MVEEQSRDSPSSVGPTRSSRAVGLVRRGAAGNSRRGRRLSTNSRAVPLGLECHARWAGMHGARCGILGALYRRRFSPGGLVGFRSKISDRTASSRSVDAPRCRSVVHPPRGGVPGNRCPSGTEDRAWALGAGVAWLVALLSPGVGAWPAGILLKRSAVFATPFAGAPTLPYPVHETLGGLVACVLTAPALGPVFAAALSSPTAASGVSGTPPGMTGPARPLWLARARPFIRLGAATPI